MLAHNKKFWKDLKTFLQFVESTVKDSPLFETCLPVSTKIGTITIGNHRTREFGLLTWNDLLRMNQVYRKHNVWKIMKKGGSSSFYCTKLERLLNMYVWDLFADKDDPFKFSEVYDYHKFIDYKRLFTNKKHRMLQVIGKFVIGCLCYSIKDLISQNKNVIFTISSKGKDCGELIDLMFMNPNMVKKLLNCATMIPHCNTIDWYENSNNILIMSKPSFPDDYNNHNIEPTLLKFCIDSDR